MKGAWDLWRNWKSGGSGAAAELDGALGGSVIANIPVPEAIELDNLAASVGENAPEAIGSQAARQAVRPTGGKVAGFSYWEEDFSVADKVSGFIGFFASCAATVALGFQVKKDFDNGQKPSVKALDILQIIDVGFGAIVGGFAFAGAVYGISFACVPALGAVLAVAGLVLMIVGIWVHPDPPETEAQKFLDGDGGSWMESAPVRPDPVLQYSLSPSSTKAGAAQQSFSLTITNPTSASSDAAVANLILSWAEGDDDQCLFKSSDDSSFVLTSPGSVFTCGVPARDNTAKVQLLIFVTELRASNAPLKPGEQMELVFAGTVGSKGAAQFVINENTTYTEDPTNPSTTTYTRDAKITIQVPKS